MNANPELTTPENEPVTLTAELNSRPRQALGWMKPCEIFGRLLRR